MTAATAAAAPGLVWGEVSEVGLPANAPSGETRMQLTDVSCPAAGDCAAIGTLEPKGEHVRALVVDETNGVWGKAAFVELPEALNVVGSQLESIDCPAVGDCSAVGYDEVVAEEPQAIVVSESGGAWGAAQVIQEPATSARAKLAAVTCTGPGSCTAVGESENSSTHKYEAVAVTETSGTWGASVAVPQPADAVPGGGLDSVSCPADGECVATGWYQSNTAHSDEALGANEIKGAWTSEGIALPSPAEYVRLYVSCAAPGSCGASGFYYESFPISQAITAFYANGKWSSSVQPIGSEAGYEYPYLETPSCPASGSCVAVGGVYSSAEKAYEPLVASASTGVWGDAGTVSQPSSALTDAEAQTLKDQRDAELYSVSCWAVGVCEAVGEFVDQKGEFAPLVVSEVGGVWNQAEEIAQPDNAATSKGEAWLSGVSCAASGICGATGTFVDAAEEYRGMTASAGSLLLVTSSSLPAGQAGSPYTVQLAATGGFGSYTWGVASGSLPAGLSLDAGTGVISGTPTGAGTSFTVSVANAGPPAQTARQALSITINPAPKSTATPTPTPKSAITIVSAKLRAAKRKVPVKLTCGGSACNGVVKIVAVTTTRVKRKGKTVTEKHSVLLATGSYKMVAGKTQTIEIKLTAKGVKLLAKPAKHQALRVKLIATVKGGATKSKAVELS